MHLEAVNNLDIWVEGEATREETEPEESRGREPPERREVAEPGKEEDAEPKDEAEDPETQRNIDLTTETSTETEERHDRTRHVPGGAWLTQVRLCFRVKLLPVWTRSGSERGSQGRDQEEWIVGKSACTYL
ncbi:hypothetical protein NDU88_002944 [Pleurodeles waltl]|uniref:Uncharacterized protein n=1 Tax=Pleurodeles waltl TaxID=8319 RepID=A0AAV7VF93_PLEWA|nr:hypothetical protein NDU88_002944 [Pleurodeles waltl]